MQLGVVSESGPRFPDDGPGIDNQNSVDRKTRTAVRHPLTRIASSSKCLLTSCVVLQKYVYLIPRRLSYLSKAIHDG